MKAHVVMRVFSVFEAFKQVATSFVPWRKLPACEFSGKTCVRRNRVGGRGAHGARRWCCYGALAVACCICAFFGSRSLRADELPSITDKTLVAWVSPSNLTQRGGSVLTIEKSGGVFDAIVCGELAMAKWMAGSNGFSRTQKQQDSFPAETADADTLVQIAIVYRGKLRLRRPMAVLDVTSHSWYNVDIRHPLIIIAQPRLFVNLAIISPARFCKGGKH